jgi:hypothetical protein
MQVRRRPRQRTGAAALGATVTALALAATTFTTGDQLGTTPAASAAECAPGFQSVKVVYNEVRHELAREAVTADAARFDREVLAELPMLASVPRSEWDAQCVRTKRPSRSRSSPRCSVSARSPASLRTAPTPRARRAPASSSARR